MGGRGRHFKKRREIRKKRNDESRRRERSQSRQRRRNRKADKRRRKEAVDMFGYLGYRQCARKRRFKTKHDAEHVALYTSAMCHVTLRAYKCDIYGGWHLTKSPLRQDEEDAQNTCSR